MTTRAGALRTPWVNRARWGVYSPKKTKAAEPGGLVFAPTRVLFLVPVFLHRPCRALAHLRLRQVQAHDRLAHTVLLQLIFS